MKRIIALAVFAFMLFAMILPMVGCEEPDDPNDTPCNHVTNDGDDFCDLCGLQMLVDCDTHRDEDEDGCCDNCGEVLHIPHDHPYSWPEQTLIFQLTENDNGGELPSSAHRYLAGDDPNATKAIDASIDHRNARTKGITNVEIEYRYWPNSAEYLCGNSVARIEELTSSKIAKNVPDVYVNFTYDLVGAMVKGCFANLKGTTRGAETHKITNYFQFTQPDYDATVDDRGYMIDWMDSLTLSQDKSYILGSDYFIDIIRSAYVIPVGTGMLEAYGESITGDRNNDGKFTVDDFYEQVYAGEWTYKLLMDYADAVKMDDGNNNTDLFWIGDERVGFAISSGKLAASGLFYSAPVSLVEKTWNYESESFDYFYTADSVTLGTLGNALRDLVSAPGVAYTENVTSGDYSISDWGTSGAAAIRTRFSSGNILFGDITIIGALENEEYQSMKATSGFGVVLLPLLEKSTSGGEKIPYVTGIYSTAQAGAIARHTTKFVECTAYLDYQSKESGNILDEYYYYELWYNVMGAPNGASSMLRYIRESIGVSIDMLVEDGTGFLSGKKAVEIKVVSMLRESDLACGDIRGDYIAASHEKQGYLMDLVEWFDKAKD